MKPPGASSETKCYNQTIFFLEYLTGVISLALVSNTRSKKRDTPNLSK